MNDNPAPQRPVRRFYDVLPAGSAAPSASSRPVIVSNRPQQPDPMMVKARSVPTVTPGADKAPALTHDTTFSLEPLRTGPAAVSAPSHPAPVQPMPGSAAEMMREEYSEVHHELTPGDHPVPHLPSSTVPTRATEAIHDSATQMPTPHTVHHKPLNFFHDILIAALILLVLLFAADLVLDSGLWKPTYMIPHTTFFHTNA